MNGNFTDISDSFSTEEFEKTKEFVLKNGEERTYRNFDNNNPHYQFSNCEVYFGADIGQRNINNDPEISDFNQLTIANRDAHIQYYELIIVRKDDLKVGKSWLKEEMKEHHVYLVDTYGVGLELLINNLPVYLCQIKQEMIDN